MMSAAIGEHIVDLEQEGQGQGVQSVASSDHQLTRCLKTLQDISEVYLEPQWITDWSLGALKLHKYLSYNICDLFRNPILRARLETGCGVETKKLWVPREIRIPITAQVDPSSGAPSPGVTSAAYTVSLTGELTKTPFHTARLNDDYGNPVAFYKWKGSGMEAYNSDNKSLYFIKTPHAFNCASSTDYKVNSSETGETIGTFDIEPTNMTDRMYGVGHVTTVFPKNFTWKDKMTWIAFIVLFEMTKVGLECAKPTI